MQHQLGMLHVRTGRVESGLLLLRQAVDARPAESLYWGNYAAACLSIERSEEAVQAARKAVELDPQNFTAWQNLGFGLRDLGDHSGAAKAFETASGLGEIPPDGLATWAECLDRLGRFGEAERIVRRALEVAPDDPAILTLLGWLQMEQSEDDAARETFKRSLSLKPEQFIAAYNYGILCLRADMVDTGLRWLRRATSIEPKSIPAWHTLAMELVRHGLREEALPVAERSLRLAPDDTAIKALVRNLKGAETEAEMPMISIDFEDPAPIGPAPEPKPTSDEDGAAVLDLSILRIGGES
jgi:Flp pilus assembly protein TadD